MQNSYSCNPKVFWGFSPLLSSFQGSWKQRKRLFSLFYCLHFKSANLSSASQVIQGLLAVFFNLGDGNYNVTLPHHHVNDGEWHEVELDRYGREFTLRLDGGGGRREVTASPGQSQEIIIDPTVVMLGNSFPSGHNRSFLGRWWYPFPGGMRLNKWKVR